MFGENEVANNALSQAPRSTSPSHYATPSSVGTAQIQQPDYGISSAIGELREEAGRTQGLSEKLTSTLGIGPPNGSDKSPAPSSLVGVLREIIGQIRVANNRVEDSIRHLNT
jgi:hypothetical protein